MYLINSSLSGLISQFFKTLHCCLGGRHTQTINSRCTTRTKMSHDIYVYWTLLYFFPPVLLLGIFLYTRWRSYKGMKEGVYHVSAHHDGWEDIRENVLNYDEEGGGEEDQVNNTDIIKNRWGLPLVMRRGAASRRFAGAWRAQTDSEWLISWKEDL